MGGGMKWSSYFQTETTDFPLVDDKYKIQAPSCCYLLCWTTARPCPPAFGGCNITALSCNWFNSNQISPTEYLILLHCSGYIRNRIHGQMSLLTWRMSLAWTNILLKTSLDVCFLFSTPLLLVNLIVCEWVAVKYWALLYFSCVLSTYLQKSLTLSWRFKKCV